MKYALSIKQPWLYCIMYAGKTVENRTWAPPTWVIGTRIALHASKRDDAYTVASRLAGENLTRYALDMPRGAIVATAVIAGWVDKNGRASSRDLLNFESGWFFGPVGWVLRDVHALSRPLPCKGARGLWKVPADVTKEMEHVVLVTGD